MWGVKLQPGRVFAGFTVVRALGAGGMGAVYLMRHPRLEADVAVKVLDTEIGRNPKARARFEREADFAARLRHPNIVQVYDRGREDETLWISMDFVDGPDAAHLVRQGPLDPQRAVDIVAQAARALDHAHHRGVVHRDVKPANLLIAADPDGGHGDRVLVTDFGIARSLDDTATLTNSVHATFAYAAPEVLNGETADKRTDIYALGCTLYQLLTGSVPFPRETLPAAMHAHLTADPPRPRDRRPELPAELDQVIATALAKDPDERYASCTALAEAARAALRQVASIHSGSGTQVTQPVTPVQQTPTVTRVPTVTGPTGSTRTTRTGTARLSGRRRLLAVVIPVVAVAAVVALVVVPKLTPTGTELPPSVTVGIKFDQPGLGLRNRDGTFSGFDVDVARYVAAKMGVLPENIIFKEAPTSQREILIADGSTDFVVATYSITDQRREKVDFAGPYFITGQSLLVRNANTDITGTTSLNNKRLCSVRGSTPAQNVKDRHAPGVLLREYDTYALCVEALKNGMVDAVTTDDIILRGYAALNPGALKVIGLPFTTERYGIGVKKGDKAIRDRINEAIEAMFADGSWQRALEANFAGTGFQAPTPPTVDWY